ncbi:anti-sigma-I factor RsgI family protein [Oceanobacillus timonensis]|uniref:anti-sigma-I factor RsgI family protein n=1 Tax=Oceanobacillus timonensis TaxID=1926285 RepID=UPI0009BA7193|nr:anti-sigma factor domain-containing protein [Oceanobacillus timonensis]
MKKGIVMEIHRKYAILLTKDGSFEKGIILTTYADQGDEVIFQSVSEKAGWKSYWDKTPLAVRLSAIVLLALFIFGFSLFYGTNNSATDAYVAIDINPSIELELNDDFVVTNIHALNDSADQLIEEVSSIQNRTVNSVLTDIIRESEDQGLAADKTMIVGVSCQNQDDNPDSLISQINTYIETLSDWDVATLEIPDEVREIAQNNHQSMNEVMAAELENHSVDIEQTHLEITDPDDRAIIDSFYGEEASDSDAGRSIEPEKKPVEMEDNE